MVCLSCDELECSSEMFICQNTGQQTESQGSVNCSTWKILLCNIFHLVIGEKRT